MSNFQKKFVSSISNLCPNKKSFGSKFEEMAPFFEFCILYRISYTFATLLRQNGHSYLSEHGNGPKFSGNTQFYPPSPTRIGLSFSWVFRIRGRFWENLCTIPNHKTIRLQNIQSQILIAYEIENFCALSHLRNFKIQSFARQWSLSSATINL